MAIAETHSGSDDHPPAPEPASKPQGGAKQVFAFAFLLLGAVVAVALLPVKDYLASLLDWTRSMGPWGPAYFVLIYAAACVLFLPGSVLTLGSGFAFGLVGGTIAACVGSLLGVSGSFLLGRTVLRKWVEEKIRAHQTFRAIDEAVAKEGFKIVLLTRLSPVFPFNLLNYAFGVTRVSFRDYFFASWIGMFPGTVMYVYFGTAVKSVADLAAGKVEGGQARYVLLALGLVATVAVTVVLTRIAKRTLKGAIEADGGSSSGQSRKESCHA